MKKIVDSERGNVHYLQFQSGTNKRDLYSGSYDCINDSKGH